MKEKKIFVVIDLGPGDGVKGGTVHKICVVKKAHTVIKVGGCQCSHGVSTSNGQNNNFHHFGCGTFEGSKTYISERMVIEPCGLLIEANNLQNEWRIHNIFDYLTIDRNCLCVTPFHTLSSRFRELLRKDNPKGIVGVGVGEALRDQKDFPEEAVYAKDLDSPSLRKKLELVRERKFEEFKNILSSDCDLSDYFHEADIEKAYQFIGLFHDGDFINRIVDVFNTVYSKITITDEVYFKNLLEKDGVMVVESSHGVLNDKLYGFQPHVTELRILPQPNIEMLNKYGFSGDLVKIGTTRAYQVRHGAGPIVTYDQEMTKNLIPDGNKLENRWQGKVRAGALDFVSLQYAIDICGGSEFFNGISVSWLDQIELLKKWDICDNYNGNNDLDFFLPDGKIKVYKSDDQALIEHQKLLTMQLNRCTPKLKSYDIRGMPRESFLRLCSSLFEEKLKIPIKMASFGKSENDRILM